MPFPPRGFSLPLVFINGCSYLLIRLSAVVPYLCSSSIDNITKVTAVAKLHYASPSCWGLTLASDRKRLEKVLGRTTRLGYLEESFPTVSEPSNIADAKLILSIS